MLPCPCLRKRGRSSSSSLSLPPITISKNGVSYASPTICTTPGPPVRAPPAAAAATVACSISSTHISCADMVGANKLGATTPFLVVQE